MPVLLPRRSCNACGQESALCRGLDTNGSESDIKCMRDGGLIPLLIIASVCITSLGLVPMGAGPYTAVHGPLSALRAQRAFLLLAYAVAAMFWLAAAWVFNAFFPLSALGRVERRGEGAAGWPSSVYSLRC